ncbi:MAG: fatty acid cis/trans isomerase [Myxococcota bacterium]
MLESLDRPVDFERDVKPVLDNRCVVCHACYDAPCQLLLSSHEGALRGAAQEPVYDSSRLRAKPPTRLFVDAHGVQAWRERDFFSVLDAPGEARSSDALLLRMLALGRARPFAEGKRLPDSVSLDINRTLTCAKGDEFESYTREHPLGGMPYGVAPLSEPELATLAAWLVQGAKGPKPATQSAALEASVRAWETFLNGESLKQRITSRYLYEHWFMASLYFDDQPVGPFFRIVRSRSAPGQPIDEIATVRPYDDPGPTLYYRLEPIESTIVHKTHMVYALGPKRLARLQDLFISSRWQPTALPGYSAEVASNPFVAFEEIPARSRYQYMLDDAQYFVMTFIRGPVCRGQVAVDVIEDQFFVSFLDPDHDLSVIDPKFLARTKSLLALPAEHGGVLLPGDLYLSYARDQHRYLDAREQAYDAIDPERRGPALDWIWDGDGHNTNALLTVFRNFDNATVVRGFVGGLPKTAWVIDYPIFERLYYDLVAGFDVFGNVAHQVSTRLYMDHLRMQSENLFLGFLPEPDRKPIRASWYVGATHQIDYFFVNQMRSLGHATQIQFGPGDVKAQLIEQILARDAAVAGPPDTLNRCAKPPCLRAGATPAERQAETALQRLASVKGAWVAKLPEVSLLRVRVDESGSNDLAYSLIHNDAHENVAFMFGEDERRLPADDTVTVYRGQFGSYPNFFLAVELARTAEFVDALRAVSTPAQFEAFVDAYGVRRTDADFWATSDWLREDLRRSDPIEAGIYDFGRFGNF